MRNIAGLQHLFVRDSRLTGEIQAWLASLDDLEYLYLEGNDFTGCIPAGLRDVQNNDLDQPGTGLLLARPVGLAGQWYRASAAPHPNVEDTCGNLPRLDRPSVTMV